MDQLGIGSFHDVYGFMIYGINPMIFKWRWGLKMLIYYDVFFFAGDLTVGYEWLPGAVLLAVHPCH